MDIFLTTVATEPDDPRYHLARACYWWWNGQPHGRLEMQRLKREFGSQRLRHVLAYQQATTPYYILADDDILPGPTLGKHGPDWQPSVLAFMDQNPRVAMCQPALFQEHTPLIDQEDDFLPTQAIGGLRVIRRAAVTDMISRLGDFPPLDPSKNGAYDQTICTGLMDKTENLVGVYTPWWATHAGRFLSTFQRKPAYRLFA